MRPLKQMPKRLAVLSLGKAKTFTVGEHVRTRGAAWQRLRVEVLRDANGLCQCEDCRTHGRLRPAHEVDHIVPLWEGGTDDRNNLQAINRQCHVRKTTAEATRRAG